MSALLIRSTADNGFDGHFRLGRFWPRAGQVVAQDAFTAEEWAVLTADPRLHIGPAPDGAQAEADAKAQSLTDAVRAVLAALEPGDFEADGLPKLAAVKARLPEGTKGLTKALLVTIWGDLKLTP
ncbi:MAG: hypothetical protein ACK5PT_05065 [Cereibacter sp.]|nr:hypothetical protein [Rhodobacter sp.]